MNSNKLYICSLALVIGFSTTFISCKKTFETNLPFNSNLESTSTVQLFIATVNATRNYVYLDSKPVNGASLVSGSIFPSQGVGFSVPNGPKTIDVRDTLSTTTQIPLTFTQSLEVGNSYTIFTYDTITSPLQKTVKNNFQIPADTSCRIRFANFVFSKTPISAVDIFSVKKQANVFTNVKITDVTDYISYPTALTDTFIVRLTGSNTDLNNITPPTPAPGNVLTPVRLIFTPAEKRNYTIVFRGSYTTVLTNATQQRTLSLITNY